MAGFIPHIHRGLHFLILGFRIAPQGFWVGLRSGKGGATAPSVPPAPRAQISFLSEEHGSGKMRSFGCRIKRWHACAARVPFGPRNPIRSLVERQEEGQSAGVRLYKWPQRLVE